MYNKRIMSILEDVLTKKVKRFGYNVTIAEKRNGEIEYTLYLNGKKEFKTENIYRLFEYMNLIINDAGNY